MVNGSFEAWPVPPSGLTSDLVITQYTQRMKANQQSIVTANEPVELHVKRKCLFRPQNQLCTSSNTFIATQTFYRS